MASGVGRVTCSVCSVFKDFISPNFAAPAPVTDDPLTRDRLGVQSHQSLHASIVQGRAGKGEGVRVQRGDGLPLLGGQGCFGFDSQRKALGLFLSASVAFAAFKTSGTSGKGVLFSAGAVVSRARLKKNGASRTAERIMMGR